jgi:hypothetical protein
MRHVELRHRNFSHGTARRSCATHNSIAGSGQSCWLLKTIPDEKDRFMFFGIPAVKDAIVLMASSSAFAPYFAPK